MSSDQESRIFLEGIEVFAFGGVTAAERQIGQRYRIDVSLAFDFGQAGGSDDLDDTINYGRVHEIVADVMRSGAFKLIETQATRIANALLSQTPASSVLVTLRKMAPPIDGVVEAAGVQVTLSR